MATIKEKAFHYLNRRKRVQVGNDKSPLCEEIERAYIEGYKNALNDLSKWMNVEKDNQNTLGEYDYESIDSTVDYIDYHIQKIKEN